MKVERKMLSLILVVLFFNKSKGQCTNDGSEILIQSCNGSFRTGSYVNVDLHAIGHPCTCTAISSFFGQLLVTTTKINSSCTTELVLTTINNKSIVDCNQDSSVPFNVTNTERLIVEAGYKQGFTSGTFHQCVRLQENGAKGGIVSVQCGDQQDTTLPSSTKKSGSSHLIFTVNDSSAANDPDNIKYIIAGAIAGVGTFAIIVCVLTIARRKGHHSGQHQVDINMNRRGSPVSNLTIKTTVSQTDESGYTPSEKVGLGFPPTEPDPIPKSSGSRRGSNGLIAQAHIQSQKQKSGRTLMML